MRKIDKVVITGATSSLGIALVNKCIENGISVLALVSRESSKVYRIPNGGDLVKIIRCSAEEYSNPRRIIDEYRLTDDYDALFHLAWTSTAGDQKRSNTIEQTQNIQYALHAVELAMTLGCRVFIGAGSQAEYGRTNEIITENTECKPETAYGIAKLCAGQITRLMCAQKGLDHVWPRILSGYGPGCQPQTIIMHTITALLEGRAPRLTPCEQIWDFMYTEDIARALLALSKRGNNGEVYVVGSGHSESLKEYIDKVAEIVNKEIDIEYGAKPYGDMTVMHLACNISKLKNDVGFVPHVSFEEGIRRTVDWIENEKNQRVDSLL